MAVSLSTSRDMATSISTYRKYYWEYVARCATYISPEDCVVLCNERETRCTAIHTCVHKVDLPEVCTSIRPIAFTYLSTHSDVYLGHDLLWSSPCIKIKRSSANECRGGPIGLRLN
jgi:hypothetical protein